MTQIYSSNICHDCGCFLAHRSEDCLCDECLKELEECRLEDERDAELGLEDAHQGCDDDLEMDACDECNTYLVGGGLCPLCSDCMPCLTPDDEEEYPSV